jgi:pimeloyl-ACP methyl ester carboxylesterase
MVFLHGLTGWWQAYTDDFDEYGGGWHIFAPDLRGHGKSSKPEKGYSLPDYAGDIIAFLQEVVGEPVVLVGHSLGALVTLSVAHLSPNNVRALIANDPPLLSEDAKIDDYPMANQWFTWVFETMKNKPNFEQVLESCKAIETKAREADLQAMAAQVIGVSPGTVKAALENRIKDGYDLPSGLRKIDCPALLLYGDFALDAAVRDSEAALFKQLIPQAVIHKFENGTHMFWWEEPEKRKRHLDDFLTAID